MLRSLGAPLENKESKECHFCWRTIWNEVPIWKAHLLGVTEETGHLPCPINTETTCPCSWHRNHESPRSCSSGKLKPKAEQEHLAPLTSTSSSRWCSRGELGEGLSHLSRFSKGQGDIQKERRQTPCPQTKPLGWTCQASSMRWVLDFNTNANFKMRERGRLQNNITN